MLTGFDDTLFLPLPPGSRIPASSVRVVGLLQSANSQAVKAGGPLRQALAHLVTTYSLRGTYIMHVYMEYQDARGGLLYAGEHAEAPVANYLELERLALRWLGELGFDMARVPLSQLDLRERVKHLAALPFAYKGGLDLTQGMGGESTAGSDRVLDEIFAGMEPAEAMGRLRALLMMG